MGILVPILFVIKFLTSTQEVLIIIGCGVLLPYGMAAILALICYKEEEEEDDEQQQGPANKSDTEEEEEPDFNLIGHHNQRRSESDQ